MTINRDAADWGQYQPQRKNVMINGDFRIWQRGPSPTDVGNGEWTADRIQMLANAGKFDVSADTDHPFFPAGGSPSSNGLCMLTQVSTTDATIAAGDTYGFQTKIEGYDYQQLHQKECTLSFWVKSNTTGTYYVSFTPGVVQPPPWSYVADYTIDVADTWEKKTITFTPGTVGDWVFNNGEGLRIRWDLISGSTFRTASLNQWVSGNFRSGTTVDNFMDSASNTFRITNIQLEAGPEATEFESRTFNEELNLCRRYYQTSSNVNVKPGNRRANTTQNNATAYSTVLMRAVVFMPVVMRSASPTITLYSPVSGTLGSPESNGLWSYYPGTWTSSTASSAESIGPEQFHVKMTASGLTTGYSYLCVGSWTAEAEL